MCYQNRLLKEIFSGSHLFRVLVPLFSLIATPASADDIQNVVLSLRLVEKDPLPKKLAADAHFVVSDEGAHWLFRDAIQNRGGAYIGVGTDPNYLMAAWARPDLLILFDFDQVVVDVHALYRLAFVHSEDPESFLQAWKANNQMVMESWIREAARDDEEARRLMKTLKMARGPIYERLHFVRKQYRKMNVATFLDNQEQYGFLRRMFLEDRVCAIRGDLTGNKALKEIAAILRKAGIPVRVYYPSNAEKYFDCARAYRENMLALPFDDRSIVIRTAGGWDKYRPDGLYTYLIQTGPDFLAWMEYKGSCDFKRMVSTRHLIKPGLGTIGQPPSAPSRRDSPR